MSDGTKYEKYGEIVSILGDKNLDSSLEDLSIKFSLKCFNDNDYNSCDARGVVKALLMGGAQIGLNLDFVKPNELLYCSDYECAKTYFKLLDDVLKVRKDFNNYLKKYLESMNLYNNKMWGEFQISYNQSLPYKWIISE